MPEMRLRPGFAYSAPTAPDPLAGFKGPTSKGRGGEGREGGMGGKGRKGKGRGGEREGRKGDRGRFDPNFSLPSAAPAYNNKP